MFAETGEKPGRGCIYLETHKKRDGSYIDSEKEKCKKIEEVLTQSPRDESVISPHDAVGKVLGVEHAGRVRCLGLGAAPGSSFKKTRLHLDGTPNPTPSTSSCSSQCQQKIARVEDHCNSLMAALKSYMILKDGQIPEELAGLFSVPSSTPSDAASGGQLINNPSGVRSSGGNTSAQHANLDAEPINDLDVD